jgi:hypothetical protein
LGLALFAQRNGLDKMKIKYRVTTVESERGWGQRYEHEDFDSYEAAANYRDRINSYNTASSAPDWYLAAEQQIKLVELA